MRKVFVALVLAILGLPGAAEAKTVYPYDRDKCFKYGRELNYSASMVAPYIRDERDKRGAGGYSETYSFLGQLRTIAKFAHAAEQCKLRQQGASYDRRCPVEVFTPQWMVSNAPVGTWSRPRGEFRQAVYDLEPELKRARAAMKKACAQ